MNIGKKIGEIDPGVAFTIEKRTEHRACIAASTVFRRRENRPNPDRSKRSLTAQNIAFVALERCNEPSVDA